MTPSGRERHRGAGVARLGGGRGVHGEAHHLADGPVLELARAGEEQVGHGYDPTDWPPAIPARGGSLGPVLQVPPNCDLTLGLTCVDKSTPGVTTWPMTADERMTNPAGLVQGGFLAAMADSSMGASAVTALEGRRASVANTELRVSLCAPCAPGDRLTCVARSCAPGGR